MSVLGVWVRDGFYAPGKAFFCGALAIDGTKVEAADGGAKGILLMCAYGTLCVP